MKQFAMLATLAVLMIWALILSLIAQQSDCSCCPRNSGRQQQDICVMNENDFMVHFLWGLTDHLSWFLCPFAFPGRDNPVDLRVLNCLLLRREIERNDHRPLLRGETWLLSFESRMHSRINRARRLRCRSKCWIARSSSRGTSDVLFSSCVCLQETQVTWIMLISQRLSHGGLRECNTRS